MTLGEILTHPWLKDVAELSREEMFTEQEINNIQSEFNYNRSMRYGRNGNTLQKNNFFDCVWTQVSEGSDIFTDHMLDTAQNNMIKNSESKSVILAPFNSTWNSIDETKN